MDAKIDQDKKLDLTSLKQAIASCNEEKDSDKLKEMYSGIMNQVYSSMEYMNSRMENLWSALYKSEEKMYSHAQEGHLPSLTPSQLKALLAAAGADEDYDVAKRTIWAAKRGNEVIVTASYKPAK